MKIPLYHMVCEILKERGSLTDLDLLSQINRRLDEPISMRDLNRALLRLEINGLVTVTWISKDVRRVELAAAEAGEGER
jgi:DNA-binding HxlR family transcriptional regulator